MVEQEGGVELKSAVCFAHQCL